MAFAGNPGAGAGGLGRDPQGTGGVSSGGNDQFDPFGNNVVIAGLNTGIDKNTGQFSAGNDQFFGSISSQPAPKPAPNSPIFNQLLGGGTLSGSEWAKLSKAEKDAVRANAAAAGLPTPKIQYNNQGRGIVTFGAFDPAASLPKQGGGGITPPGASAPVNTISTVTPRAVNPGAQGAAPGSFRGAQDVGINPQTGQAVFTGTSGFAPNQPSPPSQFQAGPSPTSRFVSSLNPQLDNRGKELAQAMKGSGSIGTAVTQVFGPPGFRGKVPAPSAIDNKIASNFTQGVQGSLQQRFNVMSAEQLSRGQAPSSGAIQSTLSRTSGGALRTKGQIKQSAQAVQGTISQNITRGQNSSSGQQTGIVGGVHIDYRTGQPVGQSKGGSKGKATPTTKGGYTKSSGGSSRTGGKTTTKGGGRGEYKAPTTTRGGGKSSTTKGGYKAPSTSSRGGGKSSKSSRRGGRKR